MAGTAAAAEGGTDLVTALPEDVLVEVFSRVRDVNALFHCAVTCRRWLRLFTDPDFLRRLWPQQDPLLGFFLNGPMQRRVWRQRHASSSSPLTFLPSPVSPVDSVNGVPFSFVPDDSGVRYSAEHLASRRGILLVQFVPPSNLVEPQRRTRFRFGLCDPITGAHDVLPHLVCARQGRVENGYAILTAADFGRPAQRFSFSRLVVVDHHDDDDHLHVHAFSAATRSWSASAKCPQTGRACLTGARAAVVHRGVAHWLYIAGGDDHHRRFRDNGDLYMLDVGIGNGHASLIKLPMRSSAVQLTFIGRDERLSVACVQTLSVDVWTRQEGGDPAAWRHARVIQIPSLAVSNMLWSQRNMGTMLAMYGANGNNVLALDLETGVIEKVMDLSQCPHHNVYYKCLPYKRDLSEFFLRQLGGL